MSTPHIVYRGDETAAHTHLTVAQNLLHKVRMMATASGAGVTGQSFAPDDTSYIYVLKVGQLEVINIFSQPIEEGGFETSTFTTLPDFLSGATRAPRIETIRTVNGVERKVLNTYKPTAADARVYDIPYAFQASPRLVVTPSAAVFGGVTFSWLSQYSVVDGSQYSGKMKTLVQILLGFGRLPGWQVQDTGSWGTDVRNFGVQVQYDSRWHRTHILHTAEDGELWLVEISITNGVIAMRLPLYKDSAWLADGSDRESIREAARMFKGLPSGKPFSTGKALAKEIAEGTTLRLLSRADLNDYFFLSPFSSAVGWSTTSTGDYAHNTGLYMHDDGIYRSRHMQLRLRIGPLKKKLQPNEPIADGSASLSTVAEGKYYHPSKNFPPPIKFFEPLIGGLLSVEMLSAYDANTSVQALPVMDTTMHVFYVDDELKLVNYFWDRNNTPPVVVDTRDPCMFIGSWEWTVQTPMQMPPTFYTSDWDDRFTPEGNTTQDLISSRDLGYWRYHHSVETDRIPINAWYSAWRTRPYEQIESFESRSERWNRAAVIVPNGARDCCVYATLDYSPSSFKTVTHRYPELTDPNVILAYQYFYKGEGTPGSCWQQFVLKARELQYNPSINSPAQCNEIVDQGTWMSVCETINYTTSPIPTGWTDPLKTVEQKVTVRVKAAMDDNAERVVLVDAPASNDIPWLARSPDPDHPEDIQQLELRFSTFGSEQLTYMKGINGPYVLRGSLIADGTQADYHFLGFT